MSDFADNNNVTFYIEQDAIIAGPQSVGYIGSAKMFDVAMQSDFSRSILRKTCVLTFSPRESKSPNAVEPYSIR